jgi:hypothetical protein
MIKCKIIHQTDGFMLQIGKGFYEMIQMNDIIILEGHPYLVKNRIIDLALGEIRIIISETES